MSFALLLKGVVWLKRHWLQKKRIDLKRKWGELRALCIEKMKGCATISENKGTFRQKLGCFAEKFSCFAEKVGSCFYEGEKKGAKGEVRGMRCDESEHG